VTRDHDLLVLQQSQDIMMITPEAFMAILRERRRGGDEEPLPS